LLILISDFRSGQTDPNEAGNQRKNMMQAATARLNRSKRWCEDWMILFAKARCF